MTKKDYDWLNGAILDEHSKRKLKILDEYFAQYLTTRCQLPVQQKFRLAIVDGFAGGGRYKCGSPGSPILFIEGLEKTLNAINIHRGSQGLGQVEIECLLIFNDAKRDVIEMLKSKCAPVIAAAKVNTPALHLRIEFLSHKFEDAYPKIKELLALGSYRNALFNLDQCGYTHVDRSTLIDIMNLSISVEIFFTFMIEPLLKFLKKSDPGSLAKQLHRLDIAQSDIDKLSGGKSKDEWFGAAERLVFENFKTCAPYLSPFSINNPDGWRYWLIHFAKSYRARQVYNDILHENETMQAHFGRSGLNMLTYDPRQEGSVYLFDVTGRKQSREQLMEDIPRLISNCGDALGVGDFYADIYNLTPAHKDEIHAAITENPDLEVITPTGGERRKANTITVSDAIKLKTQRSFFPMFFETEKKEQS